MTQHAEDIARLLIKEMEGELRREEADTLSAWKSVSERHLRLAEELGDAEAVAQMLNERYACDVDRMYKKVADDHPVLKSVKRVHFLLTAWFRYAAAVLLLLGIGAYLWLQPSANKPEITKTKPVPVKNDILPGTNKAILKLADGSEIILDDAAKGIVAEESGATIKKTGDGNVTYSSNNNGTRAVAYNTMSTPRGGQYQLVLPDGSRVWLNAASAITFPTAFTGASREVSITGEVYFEIAKNKEKPFIVKTPKDEITVLGTSFNVNAYPDEASIKTSLIEGSLKVNKMVLTPGQAYVNEKVINTNIAHDIAWKNGRFNFEDLTLEQVMRQLSRWYDVSVRYKGKMPKLNLEGGVLRTLTLAEVIEGLEGMGGLHYELKGKTLIVSAEE